MQQVGNAVEKAAEGGVIPLLALVIVTLAGVVIYLFKRLTKTLEEKDNALKEKDEDIRSLHERALERTEKHADNFREETTKNRDTLRDLAEYFEANEAMLLRIEKKVLELEGSLSERVANVIEKTLS